MKKLKGWDTYVQESLSKDKRAIELPLTDDESYIIAYPSRRQGLAIAEAQKAADADGLLVALLGPEAGKRVAELSADYPGYVLDEFLLDVMRKFGFVPDDADIDSVVEAGKSSPASRPGTRKRGTAPSDSSVASS